MDPIADKLNRVETELRELRQSADRLLKTVTQLKSEAAGDSPQDQRPEATPPPLPAQKPVPPTKSGDSGPTEATPADRPEALARREEIPPPPPPSDSESMAAEPIVSPETKSGDLEMQLGRVWSVRLGIALLTTGFIFLSRYTYDAVIQELGPGIRLTLMYLLSFGLAGAGFFFERWNESLKNYGRVVAAGGLAAVYYCGYAAYHVEALKVIDSAVAGSLLLLVSAAFFCGISLWRNSRGLLSPSLALAFYSVSLNPIGWMGCFSALVLASFGIAIMLRKRWFEVGFLVLIGSYLSYFWWQFAVGVGSTEVSHWYLAAYWLLFAVSSLAPGRMIEPRHHQIFTSINNAAFFLLFSFRVESGRWMEHHAEFCFLFGGILMGLAALTRGRFPDLSRIVHLVKGLGLITLGFALLLDGYQLFIVILLEAIVLLAVNLKIPRTATIASSWALALLSLLALEGVETSTVHPGLWIIGAAAWMVFGVIQRAIAEPRESTVHEGALLANVIAASILVFGLMPAWSVWDRGHALGLLGVVAGALSLIPVCRKWIPESLATGVTVAFFGLTHTTVSIIPPTVEQLLTSALLSALVSVPLAIWARKSAGPQLRPLFHVVTALFLALAVLQIGYAVELADVFHVGRIAIFLGLPILGTLVAGQSKLRAHALVPFPLPLALLPHLGSFSLSEFIFAFMLAVGHLGLVQLTRSLEDRKSLRSVLFFVASFFWSAMLLQGFDNPTVPFALSAVALFAAAPGFGHGLIHLVGLLYFGAGLGWAASTSSSLDLYLVVFPLLTLHLLRTARKHDATLTVLTLISLAALCWQITRDADPAPLAAAWGITGTVLLLLGLALKSRPFRLVGLLVLTSALGHLMVVDVVKLAPLPRILSFMTLGLGLLALGFVYNRFQDRLKQIL